MFKETTKEVRRTDSTELKIRFLECGNLERNKQIKAMNDQLSIENPRCYRSELPKHGGLRLYYLRPTEKMKHRNGTGLLLTKETKRNLWNDNLDQIS